MSKNQVGKLNYGGCKMKKANICDVKSNKSLLINLNFLADALVDLIRIKYNKNYVVCYGDLLYLLEENKVNDMYYIHKDMFDVINRDGILIYRNQDKINVYNTGEFEYVNKFIKYLLRNISSDYNDLNKILNDFIKDDLINQQLDDFIHNNKLRTRKIKHKVR